MNLETLTKQLGEKSHETTLRGSALSALWMRARCGDVGSAQGLLASLRPAVGHSQWPEFRGESKTKRDHIKGEMNWLWFFWLWKATMVHGESRWTKDQCTVLATTSSISKYDSSGPYHGRTVHSNLLEIQAAWIGRSMRTRKWCSWCWWHRPWRGVQFGTWHMTYIIL